MFYGFYPLFARLLSVFHRRKSHPDKRPDLILGVAAVPNAARPFVKFPDSLRTQHLGIIGLSGSGKTYLIEHMIRQDVQRKTGFAVFDVHGDLADSVIRYLAERGAADPEVYDRTVIIEPFDPERSFGFNPLQQKPHTSPFRVSEEFASMLHKRWQEASLSPRTEELLRNCFYTLSCNDETLLGLPDLLGDKGFRNGLVEKLPPGPIREYWIERYDKASAKMQAFIREPLLSRISSFVMDPLMRDAIGQKESTLNFRDAIQNGLWVVINLAKGRLGENSTILGSMLFTKLELDIMSLADVPEQERKLFAVYADELQNLTGDSFGRLIAEARKYRVAIVAGHQFWQQLEPSLRQAMLAVGSRVLFRLHYHDATELAGELAAGEKNRYIRLLTMLERGEAVGRLGHTRPVLVTIPS